MRTPLDVVAHRVPAGPSFREGVERRLATMDVAAGRLLDDAALEQRGRETLEELRQEDVTQRRLEAVQRRTAAREQRIDKQTRNAVDRAQAKRDKAADERATAAQRRRDAAALDDMADDLKAERRQR
jgi:hypothetical protein